MTKVKYPGTAFISNMYQGNHIADIWSWRFWNFKHEETEQQKNFGPKTDFHFSKFKGGPNELGKFSYLGQINLKMA